MSHTTTKLMGFFYDMKTCTKCNIEKDFSYFSKCKKGKNGLMAECKCCKKQYYAENKERHSKKAKEYYLNNRSKIIERSLKYSLYNKENIKDRSKVYVLNNREKINIRRRNRRLNDPLFKLSCDIRCLINISFKKQGHSKKSKTYQILGCTSEEFKVYIENKFVDGMSWDNRSLWHLDHIYPVSLATDEEHLIKLNHYTNFQPLWAIDNLKKSNKIIINN